MLRTGNLRVLRAWRHDTKRLGISALRVLLVVGSIVQPLRASPYFGKKGLTPAALYTEDHRRPMRSEDYKRFPGAGVLFCRDNNDIDQVAAAAWLIGSPRLVLMNAHNFLDRTGAPTHNPKDCFFQIGGRNYDFDAKSVRLGVPAGAKRLHITDDWALIGLRVPVDPHSPPQPVPTAPVLATGFGTTSVTMVSPAGQANFRLSTNSLEHCHIVEIDAPTEDGIRRARHDCNDGFGGSGSGLFDDMGHLVAMHSASLDMNRTLPFDSDFHYGSALLIEGALLDAIRTDTGH